MCTFLRTKEIWFSIEIMNSYSGLFFHFPPFPFKMSLVSVVMVFENYLYQLFQPVRFIVCPWGVPPHMSCNHHSIGSVSVVSSFSWCTPFSGGCCCGKCFVGFQGQWRPLSYSFHVISVPPRDKQNISGCGSTSILQDGGHHDGELSHNHEFCYKQCCLRWE